MRVKGKVSEFAMRIESKRHLFELAEFDEKEFEFMLSKAQREALEQHYHKKLTALFNKHKAHNLFERVIFSPRVAAVLIFTILAIGMIWYNNGASLIESKATTAQAPEVHAIDKNTRVPIEKSSIMTVSTYTEKYF